MKAILLSLFLLLSFIILSCNEPKKSQNTNKTITCTTIDDCPSNYNCVNGFCKEEDTMECIEDNDCPRDYYCNSETKCQKKTCASNGDCIKGKICIDTICVDGCIDNSDCKDNKVCNLKTNKCETKQDYRIDNNCEQGYECDQISGICVSKSTCTTQEDCAEGYKCNNSKCIEKLSCQTDEECTNEEICKSDGYRDIDSGCDSNQYCINKNPNKPACNMNSGICYECVNNEDCNNSDKPFCNTLRHLCQETESNNACITDSDCGINKKCNTDVSPHKCISMLESCTQDSNCQNSKHCDPINNVCVMCLNDNQCTEAGSTCNLNTKICESPCLGIPCSNHGHCVYNETDETVSCDCDDNYYADGLYCIYDTHNCTPDQFSNPLNASSETASLIDFGSYDNLTLGNSNCGYVEDWYKINLNANTKININITYSETNRNVSIKLYKGNDIDINNPIKSNTSPSDGIRNILYNVIEENIYYIRVLIYYTTEQKNISYSMSITSN